MQDRVFDNHALRQPLPTDPRASRTALFNPGDNMTRFSKRSLFKLAGMASLAAAAALVGCGKKDEAPVAAQAPATTAPVAAASAPAKAEPLKVAFAYVGPVGDGGGRGRDGRGNGRRRQHGH